MAMSATSKRNKSSTTGGGADDNENPGHGEEEVLNLPRIIVPPPNEPYHHLPSSDDHDSWIYKMRREMQEILPGQLFLGPYASASRSRLPDLLNAGITHIVCVRHVMERSVIRPMHEQQFNYLVIELEDDGHVSLIPYFHQVNQYLQGCIESGGKALVHGNAGISRSCALVVAYVMSSHGVSLKRALSYVQSKRFSCNPNEWFLNQLKDFEAIYQAMHDTPVLRIPLPGQGQGPQEDAPVNAFSTLSLKRSIDDANKSDSSFEYDEDEDVSGTLSLSMMGDDGQGNGDGDNAQPLQQQIQIPINDHVQLQANGDGDGDVEMEPQLGI